MPLSFSISTPSEICHRFHTITHKDSIFYKALKLLILGAFLHSALFANDVESQRSKEFYQNLTLQKPPTYYEPSSSAGYLGLSSGAILMSAFVAAGALYLMPESVTRWNKNEIGKIFPKWERNVKRGPVVDSDELWLNYVAHPYFGSLYYLQARMAGYDFVGSAFFSFMVSTFFWEYGIEAFAETPSWQDIIITPAVGSLLGEGAYQLIRYIQMNNNELFGQVWLGKLVIYVLDPLGGLIRDTGLAEAFGIYNKNAKNTAPTFHSIPITPNGKGGLQIGFVVRF